MPELLRFASRTSRPTRAARLTHDDAIYCEVTWPISGNVFVPPVEDTTMLHCLTAGPVYVVSVAAKDGEYETTIAALSHSFNVVPFAGAEMLKRELQLERLTLVMVRGAAPVLTSITVCGGAGVPLAGVVTGSSGGTGVVVVAPLNVALNALNAAGLAVSNGTACGLITAPCASVLLQPVVRLV